ncbi:ABC transporter ATP-binding protein [Phenylobacterium sp.]|jgi:iron complex transport system ATP-binding protein|uniref:ABC transporter ATP-binding protein n=1 Tax=Phenylobacterium sp. TaxID=1871053 RepID=UPI0037CA016D
MTALSVQGVTVIRGDRPVLDAASLTVAAGEMIGVVGTNGAGKTTLLRAALGLVPLKAGKVELAGRPLDRLSDAARARLAAYLPQERHVGWNMSALRIAALGAVDLAPQEAEQAAGAALLRVGLHDVRHRGVLDLSGGERACVLLARLLVTGAPLLLADEPIAGLDPDAQLLAMELLREETRRGAAVVLTLHDLSLAARFCDRLVVLHHGRIAADATPLGALSSEMLAAAFNLDGALEMIDGAPRLRVQRRVSP